MRPNAEDILFRFSFIGLRALVFKPRAPFVDAERAATKFRRCKRGSAGGQGGCASREVAV